jgi:23S rRNA-/tRNA-specific pseudouridylate synthase
VSAPADGVSVLHRDAELLVLYKPPGLVTTRPDPGPSLVACAAQLDPDAPRLHPSSRLDGEVSGLVVFARTRRATEHLLRARRGGDYLRTYLGLSQLAPEPREGHWDAPIALDPRDARKRMAVSGRAAAKGLRSALTHYRVHALLPQACSLALFPQTGRTHQLRVHAAYAGVPLLGDRAYGGTQRLTLADGRVLRAGRVMLHCARVRLPALGAGEALDLRAPIPADLTALWTALGGQAEALQVE